MDFRDTGGEAGSGEMSDVMEAAEQKTGLERRRRRRQGMPKADTSRRARIESRDGDSKSVDVRRFDVVTDTSRDALLTEFGKETLQDRYLLPGENYQDLFARVAVGLCGRSGSCPAAL